MVALLALIVVAGGGQACSQNAVLTLFSVEDIIPQGIMGTEFQAQLIKGYLTHNLADAVPIILLNPS
jgi:hypothetical protein